MLETSFPALHSARFFPSSQPCCMTLGKSLPCSESHFPAQLQGLQRGPWSPTAVPGTPGGCSAASLSGQLPGYCAPGMNGHPATPPPHCCSPFSLSLSLCGGALAKQGSKQASKPLQLRLPRGFSEAPWWHPYTPWCFQGIHFFEMASPLLQGKEPAHGYVICKPWLAGSSSPPPPWVALDFSLTQHHR